MSAHYVYRCYDADGVLIYVGYSANLASRLDTHRAKAWWAPLVAKVRAKVYSDEFTARFDEREAILSEHPRFNIMGRWRSRAAWTADMWRDYIRALEMSRNAASAQNQSHLSDVRTLFAARFGGAS